MRRTIPKRAVGSPLRVRTAAHFRFRIFPSVYSGAQGRASRFAAAVAIGDQIIDLRALADARLFTAEAAEGVRAGSLPALNTLMQLGPGVWSALRHALFAAMAQGSAYESALQACLVPQSDAEFSLPAQIGDYTDFYISIHHATAIGRLFSSGQSAAAQLQMDSDRLPRPQFIGGRVGAEISAPSRAEIFRRRPDGGPEQPAGL